jgi:hypothetical protein
LNEGKLTSSDKEDVSIRLRMDVDYAYPSRLKSFIYTALGIKAGRDYLLNSKIIARMVNESKKNVRVHWFFTPTTTPNEELLGLLDETRHEIALHVATNPYKELELLEHASHRPINYYTIHGTERLLGKLIWRRKPSEARATIPTDFPLKSFHGFPTLGIDRLCFDNPPEKVLQLMERGVQRGEVLHFHPEWLFQRGTINRRGPFYEPLKRFLEVDSDLNTLVVRRKSFFKMAQDIFEHRRDFVPDSSFLRKLSERGMDIFTFIERKWSSQMTVPENSWVKEEDNIGLLAVKNYDEWFAAVGKKTRNMVRKAEKGGVVTKTIEPNETLAEGIWKIYNETPIRQERAFPHYGLPLETVKAILQSEPESTFIGAYLKDELVGFIQLVYGGSTAIVQQILSLQKHSDKAINNALIAEAVKVCGDRKIEWLMYGRIGNHPSLDRFKENNGFAKFVFPRYYVPLTARGHFAVRLGLQRDFKDSLPNALKSPLFPVFNWTSRAKLRVKFWTTNRAKTAG